MYSRILMLSVFTFNCLFSWDTTSKPFSHRHKDSEGNTKSWSPPPWLSYPFSLSSAMHTISNALLPSLTKASLFNPAYFFLHYNHHLKMTEQSLRLSASWSTAIPHFQHWQHCFLLRGKHLSALYFITTRTGHIAYNKLAILNSFSTCNRILLRLKMSGIIYTLLCSVPRSRHK